MEAAGECVRCRGFQGGCAIHHRAMKKEMAKYFRRRLYEQDYCQDDDDEWSSPADDATLMDDRLGDFMIGFCQSYGRAQRGDGAVFKHGKLDIEFQADDFIAGTGPYTQQARDEYPVLTATAGSRYFTMGVILSYDPLGDDFC